MIYIVILFVVFALIFAITTVSYRSGFSNEIDTTFYAAMIRLRSPFKTLMMHFFSWLGGPIGLGAIGLSFVIHPYLRKYFLFSIAVTSISSILLNKILKETFDRIRPETSFLIKEKGFSFPSGHSMVNATFYSCLILIMSTPRMPDILQVTITLGAIVLILLIGLSRIYLGAHYLTDVIAGWSLGILISLSYILLIFLRIIPLYTIQ